MHAAARSLAAKVDILWQNALGEQKHANLDRCTTHSLFSTPGRLFTIQRVCQIFETPPAYMIRRIVACSQTVITTEGRKKNFMNDTK